jgi:hypothetical protein
MTQQYLRNCQLKLLSQDQSLDLSKLRVRFEIHQATTGVPNWATIRVYGISGATEKIAWREFDTVDLSVGYGNALHRLFFGEIRQFSTGIERRGVDTFVDLICQDGDTGHNFTSVNTTLAKGWHYGDVVDALGKAFKENKLKRGHTGELPAYRFPRGKVLFGAARDHMDALPVNTDCEWWIHDGDIYVIPFDATLPGEAVVVTPTTGMIGLPHQTVDGITVRLLINPRLRFGGLIKLDNSTIQTAQLDVAYQALNYVPSLDLDGLYKVFSIDHVGDTRGNEWYSHVICAAYSGTKPRTGTYNNAVPNHGTAR